MVLLCSFTHSLARSLAQSLSLTAGLKEEGLVAQELAKIAHTKGASSSSPSSNSNNKLSHEELVLRDLVVQSITTMMQSDVWREWESFLSEQQQQQEEEEEEEEEEGDAAMARREHQVRARWPLAISHAFLQNGQPKRLTFKYTNGQSNSCINVHVRVAN